MSLHAAVTLATLAQDAPAPEDVKAGWLGFGVWIALAVAVVFLAFSLRKHLGKVDFDEGEDRSAESGEEPPGEGTGPLRQS